MALQVNIPLQGGISHTDGYVRINSARVARKDNTPDWYMIVHLSVYKDAVERAKDAPQTILCDDMDMLKFPYSLGDEGDSNLIALAYSKLKSDNRFDGATDV